MNNFWIGFVAGIIVLRISYFLYDILEGLILYFQMKDYFK